MIIRSDFRCAPTLASPEVRAAILRLGGTNPYEEPLYRVCIAEERVTRASGMWSIWDESLSLEERGGIDVPGIVRMLCNGAAPELIDEYVQSRLSVRPQQTIMGMIDVPVYGDLEGWILERWKPAVCTREEWEKVRICGGPAAGVYPEHGEYVLLAGPTPYQLTISEAEDAIRQDFRTISERSPSPRERVIQRLNGIERRQQEKKKALREHLVTLQKDGPMSLRNRLSLGAGRVMQAEADKAGLKGHWGN